MAELIKSESRRDGIAPEPARQSDLYTPRCDIYETESEVVLCADLPGVKAEDLDVRYENQTLTIHGRVPPRQGEKLHYLLHEYGVGDFYRTFSIGEMIDAEKISAELTNGVLYVHLPKTEKVRPKRIEVRANQ